MMGREVRMVPPDWQHPKSGERYIPLHGGSYSKAVAEWDEAARQWIAGFEQDYRHYPEIKWRPKPADRGEETYEEWAGQRPIATEYMPDWEPEQRTHYQMYENTSEGTPLSPPFATPEELAGWLADTGASAFADMTANYEQWLATIKAGSALSMVIEVKKDGSRTIDSGVMMSARTI